MAATYTVSARCKLGTKIIFDRVCSVATNSTILEIEISSVKVAESKAAMSQTHEQEFYTVKAMCFVFGL